MKSKSVNGVNIVIIDEETPVFTTTQDALDLIASISYNENSNHIVMSEKSIPDKFFDLKTGFAGEILQKFVQYNMKVAIVGDFSKYKSKAFRDFRYECNNGNQIFFTETEDEALRRLVNQN